MVGVEGIEPTPPKWPDFESGASTSSAILPLNFSKYYSFLRPKSMSLFGNKRNVKQQIGNKFMHELLTIFKVNVRNNYELRKNI